MKARILAAVIVATSVAAPLHAAEAGILSNKLGQAVFLGKVMKGKVIDGSRKVAKKAFMACWNSKICGGAK